MICIQRLRKLYGAKSATDIDDLSIETGSIVGLLGNNGAGKTTLFSLLIDIIKADEGQVTIFDMDVVASGDWKKITGVHISESFVIDFLSPEEYFEFIAELFAWNENRLNQFLHQFEGLFRGEILGQKKYIRDLSKGNQKKVGIVGALIGDPKVIILDEPFANLDPTSQARLKQIIRDLHTPDNIILLSSHDLNHIADISNRILVMECGKIIKDLKNVDADVLSDLKRYFEV